ncbi:MAG: hypothetical protein CO064_04510 [Anaerolineae bacterium CG_4_9_14_0_8_um_filter_58_9]|nr:MAG: hypothetical protein CO064_04510 [Anaerolineae bacterium CG_4_9_14_0_8_um_filter_58_9]
MSAIQIGHLLRAGTTGFVAGCSVSQLEAPATTNMAFGALVRAPLEEEYSVYGLITDIHIDEDGLVRQLVTAENVSQEVIRDNRERRIVPVEMSVLTVGYEQNGKVSHLLPPRPPLSLDVIHLCSDAELVKFTSAGRFGYFRHVLQAKDIPIGEVLAAHILEVKLKTKNVKWVEEAVQELITLLRDDYPTLMSVLGALGEVI